MIAAVICTLFGELDVHRCPREHELGCPLDREVNSVVYRVPLLFTPQAEGGFTVTSPVPPEFVIEGDSLEEAHANVRDALAAVIELYADQNRVLPKTEARNSSCGCSAAWSGWSAFDSA